MNLRVFQLKFYALDGKLILQKNLEKDSKSLDLTEFGKGINVLRFECKKGKSFRKVVVEYIQSKFQIYFPANPAKPLRHNSIQISQAYTK